MILGRLGKGYCKKNTVLEFLAKIFGKAASGPLSLIPQVMHTVFSVLPRAHVTCMGYFLMN